MKFLSMVLLIAAVGASAAPACAASLPPTGAASCSGCHGASAAAVPRITGRDAGEILTLIAAFRDGSRPATVMGRIAKGYSDDELRPIAAWLAGQK
ncbi:c-type cytochrome [Bradyrhizobium prioriisuperbiae]|uniref:c-type cytochrome n=1 Tax=Bradyrhizobium prioriisuperbiae TaxID=2854389 RepID=UPI0028EB3895|nr:c-type cytochrome [Bradyrhizobium prioritasuperba]